MEIVTTIFSYLRATVELIWNSTVDNIFTAVESLDNDPRTYKSKFGDTEEILDFLNSGYCLDGVNCLTRKDSYQGVLVLGPTGAGKGVHIIIPSILKMNGASLVIHDSSGELAKATSGYLNSKRYRTCIINFSAPENSDSFNPLDFVESEGDINKIASLLVRTTLTSERGDPYWNISATNVLRVFISIVMTQEKQFRNFVNVKRLITMFSGSAKKVDALFIRYASDALMQDYKALVALDAKLLSSVLSTASAALQIFSDPSVAKATSLSTIDLEKIRQEKTVIFIQNSMSDAKYYSSLISIFFELLFKTLLSRLPKQNDKDVFMIIDEASTLTLPSLSTALANVRKFRVGVLSAWQSQQQIVNAYGAADADAIKDNSITKVFLTGQGLNTTTELEKILGREEYTDSNGKVKIKPLMLAEQIRTMLPTEALIVHSHRKPYKATLVPYYRQPFLNMRTRLKPMLCVNENVRGAIPLIPL